MPVKDFNIFLEKVSASQNGKDIAMVSGFNAYAQWIENVCKTQKGEIVSNMNMGSNYFSYIFSGQADAGAIENSLGAYIHAAIPSLSQVRVVLELANETSFQFTVYYSVSDGIKSQSKASTFIEVEL